jgi:nitrate reductase NapE component
MSQLRKNIKDMLAETVGFLAQFLFIVGIFVIIGLALVLGYRIVMWLL